MSCGSEGKIVVTVDSFITNYKVSSIVYNTSAAFVSVYKVKPGIVNSSIYYKPAKNGWQSTGISGQKIYRRLRSNLNGIGGGGFLFLFT